MTDHLLTPSKITAPSIGQREVPIITDEIGARIDEAGSLRWIVLDLSQVRFLNSMALGMCVDFRNRGAAMGAKTAILGMNEELEALFRMVKFDRLFTIARDEATLAKKLKG